MGKVAPPEPLQQAVGGKGWQLGLIGEISRRFGSQMLDVEREALAQVHLVFAVAEYEALMALQTAWSGKCWADEKSHHWRPAAAWGALAAETLGPDWPKLDVVPWANAENNDPTSVVAWLEGLFEMRNQIVHPEQEKAGWEERLRRASLPLRAHELGDDYLARFSHMRTRVDAVMFRATQILQGRHLKTN